MPSFHTRIPLVLMAVASALATIWMIPPNAGRPIEAPATADRGAPTLPTAASREPPTAAVRDGREPRRNPEAADNIRLSASQTTRIQPAAPQSGGTAIAPAQHNGRWEPERARDAMENSLSIGERLTFRGAMPATPDESKPSSSADRDAADREIRAAHEPPLIVPYSLLDPSVPATLPAALMERAPNAETDEALATETARLAEAFFHQIGDATEDPQDAAYQQRWLEAQEENDARMRASLGGHTWLQHHREAHRQTQPPVVNGTGQNTAGS